MDNNATNQLRSRRVGEVNRPGSKVNNTETTNIFPDDPCHSITESILSHSNGAINYRGFFNLAIILLVLSNVRIALLNLIQYGLLIRYEWIKIFFENPLHRPTFVLLLFLNFYIVLALVIEKLISNGIIAELRYTIFCISNLIVILISPILVSYVFECNALLSSVVCCFYSIVVLKLISYHSVNYWCRTGIKYGKQINKSTKINEEYIKAQNGLKLVRYSDNLGVCDIYYFMFAPTLCYQLNFPRTQHIRIQFVLKRFIEFFVITQLIIALTQQWIFPIVQNSMQVFHGMELSKLFERLLTLVVPNHIIWLLCFYSYFQSFLNLIAEIMRFGDREFYRDWWNSESVSTFWKNWNIPVHKWCVRHVFKPLVYRGFSPFQASCVVFMVSAFFHEYAVSIPLKMLRYWSFMAMMAQIPFTAIVAKCLTGHYANIAVWLSLIIGQPLAILMYYHDYYVYQNIEQ